MSTSKVVLLTIILISRIGQIQLVERHGCCLYSETIWESNKEIWQNPTKYKCHPGQFVSRRGCHFSISYDRQREMFSFTSNDSQEFFSDTSPTKCEQDGIDKVKCSQASFPEYIANSARFSIETIGYNSSWFPSASHSDWTCWRYVGNDDKPTCHNITNSEGIRLNRGCIYSYDPTTQKFRFANRTCPEAKSTVSEFGYQCYRHQDSWEYTCVGGARLKDYQDGLAYSKLPLTPVECCNFVGFNQSDQKCKDELWTRIQPGVNCHYHLQKQTDTEPTRVLEMPKVDKAEPNYGIHCAVQQPSLQLFNCQCPTSAVRSADNCLSEMFSLVEKLFYKEKRMYCCNYTNYMSTDTSHLKEPCRTDLLYRVDLEIACRYHLERKSATEPIKVLNFTRSGGIGSDVLCEEVDKSYQRYSCGCPAEQNPLKCLQKMFAGVNKVFAERPKFCCDYTGAKSNDKSLWKIGDCEDEFWKTVPADFSCHYKLYKNGYKEPVKVLKMDTQKSTVGSEVVCQLFDQSYDQMIFRCECPPPILRNSTECLRKMFDLSETIFNNKQPQKYCCNYTNFASTDAPQCKDDLWIAVQPNFNCHYTLEKKSVSGPMKVLQMFRQQDEVESQISCTSHLQQLQQYNCQCPVSTEKTTNNCLKGMFDQFEKIFYGEPPKLCCNHIDIVSSDISHWDSGCKNDWIRIQNGTDCRYSLELMKDTKVIKLVRLETSDSSGTRTQLSCNRHLQSDQFYDCFCPGSVVNSTVGCAVRSMFVEVSRMNSWPTCFNVTNRRETECLQVRQREEICIYQRNLPASGKEDLYGGEFVSAMAECQDGSRDRVDISDFTEDGCWADDVNGKLLCKCDPLQCNKEFLAGKAKNCLQQWSDNHQLCGKRPPTTTSPTTAETTVTDQITVVSKEIESTASPTQSSIATLSIYTSGTTSSRTEMTSVQSYTSASLSTSQETLLTTSEIEIIATTSNRIETTTGQSDTHSSELNTITTAKQSESTMKPSQTSVSLLTTSVSTEIVSTASQSESFRSTNRPTTSNQSETTTGESETSKTDLSTVSSNPTEMATGQRQPQTTTTQRRKRCCAVQQILVEPNGSGTVTVNNQSILMILLVISVICMIS